MRRMDELNSEWVVLVEVIRELGQQPYVNPVGRTICRRIAHVLSTPELKSALHELANKNWLREEQLGKMTAVRVGEQYERDRPKFADVIERNAKRIDKTVDLFSRIKNTDQAEEVMTVLFASRELKKAKPRQQITEKELYDYILDWKKRWRTEEKQREVAGAIRNLVMLGWMRLQFSKSLPEAA